MEFYLVSFRVSILIRILSEALFLFFLISPEPIRGFYSLGPRVNLPVLQFGKWVLATIPPLIFRNDYQSAFWTWNVKLEMMSTTFDRCLGIMTSVPVLILRRKHCHILPFNSGMILTRQRVAIYCPLLIIGEIHGVSISSVSNIVNETDFSTLHHNRYIIWEKHISIHCTEVCN